MASTPPLEEVKVGSGKLPVVSEECGYSECFAECLKEFFPDYVDYDWSKEESELDDESWDGSCSSDDGPVRSSNPIVIALELDNGDALLKALPLVESTGKPDLNANCQYVPGVTVLQHAASFDKFECVKALVDAGADLLVGLDDYGGTPLHCACRERASLPLITYLIKKSADNNDGSLVKMLNTVDGIGKVPLDYEPRDYRANLSTSIIKYLAEIGALTAELNAAIGAPR